MAGPSHIPDVIDLTFETDDDELPSSSSCNGNLGDDEDREGGSRLLERWGARKQPVQNLGWPEATQSSHSPTMNGRQRFKLSYEKDGIEEYALEVTPNLTNSTTGNTMTNIGSQAKIDRSDLVLPSISRESSKSAPSKKKSLKRTADGGLKQQSSTSQSQIISIAERQHYPTMKKVRSTGDGTENSTRPSATGGELRAEIPSTVLAKNSPVLLDSPVPPDAFILNNSMAAPLPTGLVPLTTRNAPIPKPRTPQPVPHASSTAETASKHNMALLHQRFHINLPSMASADLYTKEEDDLLIYLKEEVALSWPDIASYFPWRTGWQVLQTRYSRKFSRRNVLQRDLSDGVASMSTNEVTDMGWRDRPKRATRHNGPYQNAPYLSDLQESYEFMEDTPLNTSYALPNEQIRMSGLQRSCFQRFAERTARNRPQRSCRQDIEQFRLENVRNLAALSSMTAQIRRSQVVERDSSSLAAGMEIRISLRRPRPSINVQRPYLSIDEQQRLQQSSDMGFWDELRSLQWNGQVLHVDFIEEEVQSLESSARTILSRELQPAEAHKLSLVRISDMLKDVGPGKVEQISKHALARGAFLNRTINNIQKFLHDAATGRLKHQRSALTLRVRHSTRTADSQINVALRSREALGFSPGIGRQTSRKASRMVLDTCLYDSMGPELSFIGTSGDVGNVAWASNGELFAAGSAALMDAASMQYNLPNNLLLGNLTNRTLYELPNHATERVLTERGANARREMLMSQDPLLFTTVSAARFSTDGRFLFSAGYDNVVRTWDVSKDLDHLRCIMTIPHQSQVDLLEINQENLVATGAKIVGDKSVQVFRHDSHGLLQVSTSFSSERAIRRLESRMVPACLKWGSSLYSQQRYLLCGFSPENSFDGCDGEVCLWDVERPDQILASFVTHDVFDVAWSPSIFGRFAVGCLPGVNANRGTNSVVRLFDSRYDRGNTPSNYGSIKVDKRHRIELECPALDMNDVVFNPYDETLISAGCTDGSVYVWDLRNPNDLLHLFKHDKSLAELDESVPQEAADTGVNFVSWGASRTRLYTGSSDGVVKSWNPYLSPDNAHVRDVIRLNSGVMSGAFSPDFSNLLLGEINGSIAMLSVGMNDQGIRDVESFTLRTADEEKKNLRSRLDQDSSIQTALLAPAESGVQVARELLDSGQMIIRPFGNLPVRQAVRGPGYSGPFDKAVDANLFRTEAAKLQAKFEPSADPCQLQHSLPGFTEEEIGDSRASLQRIPDQLRTLTVAESFHDPGLHGCFRCGTSMRNDADLCDGNINQVYCDECDLFWRVDSLGFYELLDATDRDQVMIRQSLVETEDIDTTIDELQEHYHSLWQNTPPSPI